jgi:hypothetical protein
MTTQNGKMKVLLTEFHRRTNLTELLYGNLGFRNKISYSELEILKILRVLSYKPRILFTICENYSRNRCRSISEDNFYGSFEFKNFIRNFGFSYRIFGFSNRNFEFFEPKLRVFQPKLRVFENQSFVFLNK